MPPTRSKTPASNESQGHVVATTLEEDSQSSSSSNTIQQDVIPSRPGTPDELLQLQAQRDIVVKARREATMARLRKEIEDNQRAMKSEEAGASKSTSMAALRTEGTDPKILLLIELFPTINQSFFKQIMDNKFDPINISKLCTDVSIVKTSKKSITIAKGLEIVTDEDDASYTDIKGFSHLLRCLIIYYDVMRYFAHPSIKDNLSHAFTIYLDRLLTFYNYYTWESVLQYHLAFHRSTWNRGIDDPALWTRQEINLESMFLIKRDKPRNNPKGSDNGRSPASNTGMKPYLCNCFNAGRKCKDCKYQHICSICGKQHSAQNCRFSSQANPNLQPVSRREWLSDPYDHIAEGFPYPLVDKLQILQPGPLKLEGWKTHLRNHPDKVFKQTVFDIIQYGAKIGYIGPDQFIPSPNLISKGSPRNLTKDVEEQNHKMRSFTTQYWIELSPASNERTVKLIKGNAFPLPETYFFASFKTYRLPICPPPITFWKPGASFNLHILLWRRWPRMCLQFPYLE